MKKATAKTEKAATTKKVKAAKVETVVIEAPAQVEAVSETQEQKQLGRKVNPNSERQKRLAEKAAKIASGEIVKRGRPVEGESARQKRLAELQAKAEANGGVLKRGRPTNGESARQKKLAERQAKIEAGAVIKRGRPAMPKVEVASEKAE